MESIPTILFLSYPISYYEGQTVPQTDLPYPIKVSLRHRYLRLGILTVQVILEGC